MLTRYFLLDGKKLKVRFFISFIFILGYIFICNLSFSQNKDKLNLNITKEASKNEDKDKAKNENSNKLKLDTLKTKKSKDDKDKAKNENSNKLKLDTLKTKKSKDDKDSKELKLKSVKPKKEPSWIEIYGGGGYLLELNNKGYELYFSIGVQLTVSSYFELRFGIFVDVINGSQLILEDKDSIIFYGIEFGTLFYPYKKWYIKPFLGANISLTLYPGLFVKTMGLVGFKVSTGSLFNISFSYSISYTTANNLDSFFSHIGFVYFSFEL